MDGIKGDLIEFKVMVDNNEDNKNRAKVKKW